MKRSAIAFAVLMIPCFSNEVLWWNHGGLVLLVSFMSLRFSFNYSLVLLWEFLGLVTLDYVLAFANYY